MTPEVMPVSPVVVIVTGDCAAGVTVTVAVADFELSALLTAVIVTRVFVVTFGAL